MYRSRYVSSVISRELRISSDPRSRCRLFPVNAQHGAAACYHGFDLAGWHGLAEIEALHLFASCEGNGVQLIKRLDAFGDRAHLHLLRKSRNRMDDGDAVLALRVVEVGNERAVDLDLIEREAAQIAERGVSRTEIIEREFDAERPQLVQ